MVVVAWLAKVTRADNASVLARHRAAVLWALSLMHTTFSTAGCRLTDGEAAAVKRAGRTVLSSCFLLIDRSFVLCRRSFVYLLSSIEKSRALLDHAEQAETCRWHMVPKIRIFHHIVRDIARTRRNPASHW